MEHEIQNWVQWAYISTLNTDLIPDTIQEVLSLENWEARNDSYFYELFRCMSDLCKDWKSILPDCSSETNSVKSFTGSSCVLILRSQLHKENNILNNTFTLLIYIWNSVLKLWNCLTQKPGLRDINLNNFTQQKVQSRKSKIVHVETLPGILNAVQLISSMPSRKSDSYSAQAVQALQEPENDNSDKKNWNSLQNITENYFETAINWSACLKRPASVTTDCMF
ncbi:uncharacterized protein CIMG_13046 [Coccidioides immitis RS]|uniref:Uncharacterized protein n=1 Tax=Coccidioides immitis (strain RS) TaxID=246410 RepID=A0A0D8JTC1_COCIM|nr:uncharacterized protein CIMG_13046 [Coccidioides immitis RS]KJF60547.1 hypothetical protein CIMG_13046 [Coccidioides immitis RS]